MGETYYEVLGVSPDATPEEIEEAYRERVLETHPDHSEHPDATERFQRVTTAESVLSDEVERARYDRLGHEAYVSDTSYMSEPTDDVSEAAARAASSGTSSSREGPSHHARQRRRRQRATGDFDNWKTRERRAPDPEESVDGADFSYDVHDWDGDVDLSDPRPSLDHHTLVIVGCVGLFYPVFVLSSITPAFPLPVNASIALLTLLVVGWLLTMPRIATMTFGSWSLVVTGTFTVSPPVNPFSLLGLVALACFWIPFGYALAINWALRP